MHLPALLAAFSAALPAGWDLPDDLAALTAAEAGARELATRRLCAELTPDQRPALMRLAEDADYELERRITRILAAREERLSIAVELFAGRSRQGRAIGRAAFLELLSRWNPSYAAAPIAGERARSLLVDSQRGIIQVPRSVSGAPPPWSPSL